MQEDGTVIRPSVKNKITGLTDGLADTAVGMVKGTAFDHGNATLEASTIADGFWRIYQGRSELSVNIG